jgi:hypothetical protein
LPPKSAFAGFRFPAEVIVVAVRWYLHDGLVEVLRSLCDDELFQTLTVDERIHVLGALGVSLGAVGPPKDAVVLSGQAAELVCTRQLEIDGSRVSAAVGVNKPSAATTLTNYAHHLAALDRAEESLFFSTVAVTLIGQWLQEGGDETDPRYAGALSAYATALANVGRLEESLQLERQLLSLQLTDSSGRRCVSGGQDRRRVEP